MTAPNILDKEESVALLKADIIHLKDLLNKQTQDYKVLLDSCAEQVILAQQSLASGNAEFVEVYLEILKDKLTVN